MGTLPIFILVTLAILFGALVMVLCTFLGPKKPTPEKLAPYECGCGVREHLHGSKESLGAGTDLLQYADASTTRASHEDRRFWYFDHPGEQTN